MDTSLNNFNLAEFQFILMALDGISLPVYKGSTLRGGFGVAFKRIVCVNRDKVCDSCLLKGKCVYSYVFETPPPSDTSKMRKYPFAPHPYIITPPLEKNRIYKKGEPLCFDLTLVGKSIDYLPYFIYTFDELGKIGIGKGRGSYQLEEVKSQGETIYSSRTKTLKNNYKTIRIKDLSPSIPQSSVLHITFLTPTRLKFDGKLTPTLEFHVLIRNLLRRISLLSYFHCGEELNLDFKGIIEKSQDVAMTKSELSWIDWERYSNRQETKMKMGGFMGSVTYSGDFDPFLPFILLGEHIHVGKGTSFGLGKYKVIRGSE